MEPIRSRTDLEEIDYLYLMDCLKDYASPRAKITRLLRDEDLIRIKKGLYTFGKKYRREPVNLEVLANKIYGPSYVSLEYALMYYGMIPEHVQQVTSVVPIPLRKKEFKTPLGYFTYTPIPNNIYSIGFTIVEFGPGRTALIATPEKALADLFYVRRYTVETIQELEELLFSDLRIEAGRIYDLDIELLKGIDQKGRRGVLTLLIQLIENGRKDK